jgi:hypothetical protein
MPSTAPTSPAAISPRTVQLAITLSIVVMLAGLALPGLRTWKLERAESIARADMEALRDGLLRFMADTGVPPTRGRNGDPRALYRLLGPGLIAEGSYCYPDLCQGNVSDHLVANAPQGRALPGYDGWRGPYVDRLGSDPWGYSYVVVVYPLPLDDDRDALIVSAGPNGRMDGSYASPRDAIAAGDDLICVVLDKSPSARAPAR